MKNRAVELQPAWVLHSRPYRESSLIVDLLTRDHRAYVGGGQRCPWRGHQKGRPRRGQLLQPFTALLVSWQGKTELKTLKSLEQGRVYHLSGMRLFGAMYANELLQRVLQPWQALDGLPELYLWLLEQLATDSHLEHTLRLFEKRLLALLGYALPLEFDAADGEPVQSYTWYHYDVESSFWPVLSNNFPSSHKCFSGAMLLALAREELPDEHLLASKVLMREAIAPLLGGRPLRSRELFRVGLPQTAITQRHATDQQDPSGR